MLIKKLVLQNFRCFSDLEISFQERCVVLQGKNGAGKSSVLEALHYSCYLKSFRTHVHRDLIKLGENSFFIRVQTEQQIFGTLDVISVGYSACDGKVVKYNEKPVQSYKELLNHYRFVTLAADDLMLVHGAPDGRREFLNYALFLLNPALLTNFKRYRQVLDQRNALLQGCRNHLSGKNFEDLEVWSSKLWQESCIIKQERIKYLQSLEAQVNQLLKMHFSKTDAALCISFEYADKVKQQPETFDSFWGLFSKTHLENERHLGRTLFGVHLDDFTITFQSRKARIFASRGQQKLIVFLIKVAQLIELGIAGEPGVLLLDDFLTDFDDQRIQECFSALCTLTFQVIVTSPTNTSALSVGGFSTISL